MKLFRRILKYLSITLELPAKRVTRDAWYSFDKSVRSEGYRVLAKLDETTCKLRGLLYFSDIAMHTVHPLLWSHCVGRGRAFYSALGHDAESFGFPLHRQMLENTILWSASEGRLQGRTIGGCHAKDTQSRSGTLGKRGCPPRKAGHY